MPKSIAFFLSLVLSTLASLTALYGQEGQHTPWCGTHGAETNALMLRRLQANKAALASVSAEGRTVQYIPIKFHLIANTDGTGRVSEMNVLGQLCELNEDFEPLGIQFFLKDGSFNNINNSTVFSNHSGTVNTIMTFQRNARALNVWVVGEIADNQSSDGQTLAYYSPVKDWIVIRKANVGPNDATLTHEIGHYLSLPHPFLGWDASAYSVATHGTPAPVVSPGGVPTELASGSNCETAGDQICDTPADYNLGLGWSNCNYTGGARDPNNELVNPEEKLYMGYFLNCPDSEYFFSPMQEQLMLADLASNSRNYLRLDAVPPVREITDSPVLLSPIDSVQLGHYNAVNLTWQGVQGADAYVLEISRVSTHTISPIRMVVFGTNKIVTGLEPNRRYFWRVRPFNAHRACTTTTANGIFFTGVLTADESPKGVESFSIAPNPVGSGQPVRVTINPETSVEATINLYDLVGRRVMPSRRYRFTTVGNTLEIETSTLAAGVYFLQITMGDQQVTERIIVAR